jgi:hypothetical protein
LSQVAHPILNMTDHDDRFVPSRGTPPSFGGVGYRGGTQVSHRSVERRDGP